MSVRMFIPTQSRHSVTRSSVLHPGVVVLIGLACLLAACTDSGMERQEVADYVGGAVAANLEEPVQELARNGDGDAAGEALDGLVDRTLDDLEVPSGVSRFMEGSSIGWHYENGAAWVSTAVVVIPEGDSADPYCVAIGVHSDGRVITRPSSADPFSGCGDAREGDFD